MGFSPSLRKTAAISSLSLLMGLATLGLLTSRADEAPTTPAAQPPSQAPSQPKEVLTIARPVLVEHDVTPEQLALRKKVCDPQVKKLEAEYESIKAYYPPLVLFASELESKISSSERARLQQTMKIITDAEQDFKKCAIFQQNQKEYPMFYGNCQRYALSKANSKEMQHEVKNLNTIFAELVRVFNRRKSRQGQVIQVGSIPGTSLAPFFRATFFVPATHSIHMHTGEDSRPFLRAFDTKQDIASRMGNELMSSKEFFVALKLRGNVFCDGYTSFDFGGIDPESADLVESDESPESPKSVGSKSPDSQDDGKAEGSAPKKSP